MNLRRASKKMDSALQLTSIFSMLFFLSSPSLAANSNKQLPTAQTSTTTEAEIKEALKAPPLFSGMINISRSRNMIDFQDGTMSEGMTYSFKGSLKVTTKSTLSFSTAYSQDLKDSANNTPEDSSLSLSRPITKVGSNWKLGGSISAILPTSKASSTRDNLIVGLRTGLNLSLNPEVAPGWSFLVGIGGGQNIHKYDTNINGSVLNKYSLSQTISAGKELGKFALSIEFINKNAWTYQGYMKQAFEHTEELGYQLSDSTNIALGHSNSGNALKPDGRGSNIALLNENSSLVYGSVTFGF